MMQYVVIRPGVWRQFNSSDCVDLILAAHDIVPLQGYRISAEAM